MKINTKDGKQYKILEIRIQIHLQYWYFYSIDHKVSPEMNIHYTFLCFTLTFGVEEIKDKKSIVFGK